ncbi:hypothetical protein PV327_005857 [Microctonus hyperodae]|uniref:Uncharacterized protein n=1 Tax=Microctonus hyperodae TaxID=165561 RepID=A0AA39L002_MICHY|nr:hypothetical protein PV327_005857 [Microctonus hyperodae]
MRVIIFLLIGLHCDEVVNETMERNENILYPPPVVYPYGGTLKLVVGIAAPILFGGRILVYSQNFQFQYALPQNATIFTDYFSSLTRRRRRDIYKLSTGWNEKKLFYQLIEHELQRWGGDGRSCMMKSICEVSSIPLGSDEGLVEELLNVILTPNYGNITLPSIDENYLNAHEAGKRGDDCGIIYSSCPTGRGLLDYISKIVSINAD